MKTIDKLKKRLLENPKIKMIVFDFPQDTNSTVTLSDILEENPPEKYFLSEKMVERLMTYKDNHTQILSQRDTKGRKLPARTLLKVNSMHKILSK